MGHAGRSRHFLSLGGHRIPACEQVPENGRSSRKGIIPVTGNSPSCPDTACCCTIFFQVKDGVMPLMWRKRQGVKQMFFSSGDRLFLEYFLFGGVFRRDADIRILNPKSILNIVGKQFKYHRGAVFRMISPPKGNPSVPGILYCFLDRLIFSTPC